MARYGLTFYYRRPAVRDLALLFTLIFIFTFAGLINKSASATTYYCNNNGLNSCANYTSTNNNQTNPPAPYMGEAPIAAVQYPGDGSTVTITKTGAVIKQSPNGTPYREGWVNPCQIGSLNNSDEIASVMKNGDNNPYTNGQYNYNCNNNGTNSNTSSVIRNTSSTTTVYTASSPSNTTSNVVPAVATTNNPSPTNYNQTANKPTTLPNTGPGMVAAIGGLATFLGTIGHFIIQRLKYS